MQHIMISAAIPADTPRYGSSISASPLCGTVMISAGGFVSTGGFGGSGLYGAGGVGVGAGVDVGVGVGCGGYSFSLL